MSTNYVAYIPDAQPVQSDSRVAVTYRKLSFGRSSAGWVFLLDVYPDLGILTMADWVSKMDEAGAMYGIPAFLVDTDRSDLVSLIKAQRHMDPDQRVQCTTPPSPQRLRENYALWWEEKRLLRFDPAQNENLILPHDGLSYDRRLQRHGQS